MRFAVVGGCGFVADAGLLALAVHVYGADPLYARAFSFSVAVAITWLLNRSLTFAVSQHTGLSAEFFRYFLVSGAGFFTNFLLYKMLIDAVPFMLRYPVTALVPSAIVAAVVTYVGSSRLVFRTP